MDIKMSYKSSEEHIYAIYLYIKTIVLLFWNYEVKIILN